MAWLILLPQLSYAADEEIGANGCGSCHQAELKAWARGPHALATKRLTDLQAQDLRCRSCHEPYGASGLRGVQCESCHGLGTFYARDNVMRDKELSRLVGLSTPTEATCLGCHRSAPSLRTFDFKAAIEKIRHWPLEASVQGEGKTESAARDDHRGDRPKASDPSKKQVP